MNKKILLRGALPPALALAGGGPRADAAGCFLGGGAVIYVIHVNKQSYKVIIDLVKSVKKKKKEKLEIS